VRAKRDPDDVKRWTGTTGLSERLAFARVVVRESDRRE